MGKIKENYKRFMNYTSIPPVKITWKELLIKALIVTGIFAFMTYNVDKIGKKNIQENNLEASTSVLSHPLVSPETKDMVDYATGIEIYLRNFVDKYSDSTNPNIAFFVKEADSILSNYEIVKTSPSEVNNITLENYKMHWFLVNNCFSKAENYIKGGKDLDKLVENYKEFENK